MVKTNNMMTAVVFLALVCTGDLTATVVRGPHEPGVARHVPARLGKALEEKSQTGGVAAGAFAPTHKFAGAKKELAMFKQIDMSTGHEDGFITEEKYLKFMKDKFQEAADPTTKEVSFDQFFGMLTRNATEYTERVKDRDTHYAQLAQRLQAYKAGLFERPVTTLGLVLVMVAGTILNANTIYDEFYDKNDNSAIGSGKFVPGIVMIAGTSILATHGMVRMIARRLNDDPHLRLKDVRDKTVFSWLMIVLTLGMLNCLTSEIFWRQMGGSSRSVVSARKSQLHSDNLGSIVAVLIVFTVVYYFTYRSKVSDLFFVGMVRLIFVHAFFCALFGFIINAFQKAFDGVDSASDAMYLSVIIHTTVGYGDFSILPGIGRVIAMCHAIVVQGINFVSVAGFVAADDIDSPEYTQMPNSMLFEYGLLIPLLAACSVTFWAADDDVATQEKDGRWSRVMNKKKLMERTIPSAILQLVVTGVAAYQIVHVLGRRIKGEAYSNDMQVVGKLAIFLAVSYICLSYNETKLLYALRVANEYSLPWISLTTLFMFFTKTYIMSMQHNISEDSHDMISLNFTFTANLGVMYLVALIYWFHRKHFGMYDNSGERVDEYVGCSDYNATSETCTQNITVSLLYACPDCDVTSITTSLPMSSVLRMVRRDAAADEAVTTTNTSTEHDNASNNSNDTSNASTSTDTTDVVTDLDAPASPESVKRRLTLLSQLQKSGLLPTSPTHTRFNKVSPKTVFLPRVRPSIPSSGNAGTETIETTTLVQAETSVDDRIIQNMTYTIHSFIDALYFSAITHTTVGFGDINGANDFVAHILTMLHSWLVMVMNCATIVALIPDREEALHSRLKAMKLNEVGHPARDTDLNFVNMEILNEMNQEDFQED